MELNKKANKHSQKLTETLIQLFAHNMWQHLKYIKRHDIIGSNKEIL